jgi:hypothetical protein
MSNLARRLLSCLWEARAYDWAALWARMASGPQTDRFGHKLTTVQTTLNWLQLPSFVLPDGTRVYSYSAHEWTMREGFGVELYDALAAGLMRIGSGNSVQVGHVLTPAQMDYLLLLLDRAEQRGEDFYLDGKGASLTLKPLGRHTVDTIRHWIAAHV